MNNTTETFPGFDCPAEQLSKFIAAGDTFTMLLKDGSIVHHTTKQHVLFKEWLIKNNIEDIKVIPVAEQSDKIPKR